MIITYQRNQAGVVGLEVRSKKVGVIRSRLELLH